MRAGPAVLIFIDGTICDTRHRHHLQDSPAFYASEVVSADVPVAGSVDCLRDLSERYELVYLGARRASTLDDTRRWLLNQGFPAGQVFVGETHANRLKIVRDQATRFDFVAGIGDRWDDNELHLEIGCLSIILQEFAGNWDRVRRQLLS